MTKTPKEEKKTSAEAKKLQKENETLHKATEKQEKEIEDLKKHLAYLSADFDNYCKRTEKEKNQASSVANSELVISIFPILDNFRRATEHTPNISLDNETAPQLSEDDLRKINAYFEGVRQIEKQLEEVLINTGLTRVETINKPFDPRTMEAIAYEPHPELGEDIVIDELEGGYCLNDQVIRPAKVRVSSGP